MPGQNILQIEGAIASAHRSLWYAREVADRIPNDTIGEDLNQLLVELERLQVGLLRGAAPRRSLLSKRTYLYDPLNHDGCPSS